MNQPVDRIFQHITQLALDIHWPINSFQLLSTLIDLSQLTEIWLFLSDCHYFESKTLHTLLRLAYNVQTLGISYRNDSTEITKGICSVISRQVKHLKVQTTDVECMQLVLQYVENVSSVTFIRQRGSPSSWTDMIKWLTGKGKKISLSDDTRSLQVWLDVTGSDQTEITHGH